MESVLTSWSVTIEDLSAKVLARLSWTLAMVIAMPIIYSMMSRKTEPPRVLAIIAVLKDELEVLGAGEDIDGAAGPNYQTAQKL